MDEQPFRLERDPALGRELRALLDGGDPDAFAARVAGRLPMRDGLWQVLAGWARPGIAAALLLATALGYWMTREDTAAPGAASQAEMAATDRPLDSEVLMGVALGGDR
jgi:hypothetical protein